MQIKALNRFGLTSLVNYVSMHNRAEFLFGILGLLLQPHGHLFLVHNMTDIVGKVSITFRRDS